MDSKNPPLPQGAPHLENLEPRVLLASDPVLSLGDVTSSTVTVNWGTIPSASQIRVYLAAEPSTTAGNDLPGQVLIDTLAGSATSYTFRDLAASANVFFRVEADVPGEEVATNIHARTVGGPDPSDTVLDTPLREVLSYGPNILNIVMTDVQQSSTSGNLGDEWQSGSWTIKRADGSPIEVREIHRNSYTVGAYEMEEGYAEYYSDEILVVDHNLFFVLDEAIGNREILTIDGPFGTHFILPFSDEYIETPIIQLNQVGYNPRATERWAYVSGWMGDGGALPLSIIPNAANVLIESNDPMAVRSKVISDLPVTLRSAYDAMAGGQVDQIDLSMVPAAEGVKYRIQLEGVGVSWVTAVSEEAAYKAYFTITRGLYHQRWAGEYYDDANSNGQFDQGETAYTDWVRDVDHPTVFTGEMDRPEDVGAVPFPETTPQTGERAMVGGWHDAGDFDQSTSHPKVTQMLLRTFEIDSSRFNDDQLYLPETGNGIPDLLDEALWGIKGWACLQEANGGVRAGVESWRHPWGYYFSDDDPLPYWTYAISARHTARVAGLFAQASYLVEPYDSTYAAELEQRAIDAYNYAKNNGADNYLLAYGASELYRLTGSSTYKTDFETYWDAGALQGMGDPVTRTSACYDYVQAYVSMPGARSDIKAGFEATLASSATGSMFTMEETWAHRNLRTPNTNQDWSNDSAQGKYLEGILGAYRADVVSAELEQQYFNTMSLAADYVLGGNALGFVWFTGMGTRHVENILQLDSLVFDDLGYDMEPGIGVYGITEWISNGLAAQSARNAFYPIVDSEYPIGRRYADVRTLVGNNEFTIHETQAPHIALFATLLGDDMTTPDSWLPGQAYSRSDLPGGMTAFNEKPTVDAGAGQSIQSPTTQVTLAGKALDDGYNVSTLTTTWSKVSGPGSVTFGNVSALSTTATFSATGTYVLQLLASDGSLSATDTVTIAVAGAEEHKTDDATVALFHFNNGWEDASYNGLTLTAYGNATRTNSDLGWMTTQAGNALRVQNVGDYVTVSIPDELFMRPRSNMSIETRIKINAYKVNGVTSGPVVGLFQNSDSAFLLDDPKYGEPLVKAGTATVLDATAWASAFSTGAWHTLKFTYDVSTHTTTVYVDGSSVGSVQQALNERDNPWVLTIGNFDGYIDEFRISRGLRGINQTPAVNAGPDQSIVLAGTAYLEARVIDDGLPSGTVSYTWSKVSGPGSVSFANASAVQTTATFSAAGTYVLRMTAGDGSLSGADDLTITVGSQSPWVSAGDDDEVIGDTASLNGTVIDDGLPSTPGSVAVTWSKLSGPGSVTFGNANAIDTTATFSLPGIYVLQVTASDGEDTTWDTVTITSRPVGQYELGTDGNTTALWHFNSDATDSSGHGYTLTLAGNAELASDNLLWMTSPSGQALRVYAYGDYATISIADSVIQGTAKPISLETRFYVNSYKAHGVENANLFALYQNTDARIQVQEGKWSSPAAPGITMNAASAVTNTTWNTDVQLGIWHDLKMNIDGSGSISVYLDGDLWATATSATNVSRTNTWVVTLGNFDGYIDEVRISDIVRTPGGNAPPSVSAGSDQSITLPDDDVTLDGTVSDDGQPASPGTITTTWSKVSGPGSVTFGNASAVDTTAEFSTSGTYVLRLTADDGDLTTYDELTVTVNAAAQNAAPSVNAGSDDTITLPGTASLNGTVSDDGLPNPPASVTTTWTKQSGPGTVTFGNANAVDTTATFSAAGTYVLRLTASDSSLQAYDEVTITVNAAQQGGGSEYSADADTIALWHFNGNYSDASGNGRTLTAYGNATLSSANLGWMSSPSGQHLRTSAIGDYVSVAIPDSAVLPTGGQSFTMEARFYARDYLAYGVENYHVITLYQNGDTTFQIQDGKWNNPANPTVNMNGTSLVSASAWNSAVSLNAWHLLKLTYDTSNGAIACYIDGSLVASGTDSANISRTNDWLLTLGNFDGDIDEVRLSKIVRPTNEAPVATADSYSTNEDTQLIVSSPGVLSNDTDGNSDPLTAVKVSDPSHGSVTLNSNGSFTYTPTANWSGVDSFTYKANDGSADSNTVTVSITVNAVNDAPVAVANSYSTNEDTQLVVNAPGVLSNDTDVEGSTLTAIKVTDPSHGSLTLNSNGSFTYTPTGNWSGSDSFTYKANDGTADSNTVTVSLTVNAVNDAPSVTAGNDASITLPATASLDGTVTDVDSSPTVTWTKTSGPGTVTFDNANAVDTTATFSQAGTYVLRLTANDGTSQPYDEVAITVHNNEEFQDDASTIALYNFNSNANDSSGNGYNLTLNGNATLTNANLGWMTNPTGQVLRTSAIGDTATFSFSDSAIMPSGGQSITIEARFYARDWLAYGVNNYDVIGLYQNYDSAFQVQDGKWNNPQNPTVNMNGTTLVGASAWSSAVSLNAWHLLKLTYNSSTGAIACYIDGNLIASGTDSANNTRTNNFTFTLGNFDGDIDDVRISSTVR